MLFMAQEIVTYQVFSVKVLHSSGMEHVQQSLFALFVMGSVR